MNPWVAGLGLLIAAGGLAPLVLTARDLRTLNPLVLTGLVGRTASTPESPAQSQRGATPMTETVETDTKPAVEAPEEPGEFGVIGFTHTSPRTHTRKQYIALKTPVGWQTAGAGASESVPRITSYATIVGLADEGSILVLGELPAPVQPEKPEPSAGVTEHEDYEDDADD